MKCAITSKLSLTILTGALSLAMASMAHAKGGDGSTSSGSPILPTYPSVSAPAGAIAMSAQGSHTITGTGGTTVTMAWNQAARYMYFQVPNVLATCQSKIAGGQLMPNGSAVKTSANNTYTVKQNFYCYSGAYKGWLESYSTAAYSVNVGKTISSQVCLTQVAPAGGVVVKVASLNGRVSVPTSVTIAAGNKCASITITGTRGSGTENVYAMLNGYAIGIMFDVY